MRLNEIHQFDCQVQYDNLDMYSVTYHPEYLKLCDKARNKAFEYFEYPVEQQLEDKVGFTVASISCNYFSPLFMGEEISIFTKCTKAENNKCSVSQYITLKTDQRIDIEEESSKDSILFKAEYLLVLVSIADIQGFPLNRKNVKDLKVIEFTDKVKKRLQYL